MLHSCVSVRLCALLFAATSLVAASGSARAEFNFTLGNHPNGAENPPPYGLRVDDLYNSDPASIYTFNFEAGGAGMTMTVGNSGDVAISGQVFGGQLDGSGGYVGGGKLWDVSFAYSNAQVTTDSNGDLVSVLVHNSTGGTGSGTISSGSDSFDLVSYANGSGKQFAIETGHRGVAGFSGYGWLGVKQSDGSTYHTNYQDWLFTATPVPAPPALALFAVGALGFVPFARRRTRSTAA